MQRLDGYVGVGIWDGQIVNDLLFSILLALLIMFSIVFRTNYSLFEKMLRDIVNVKERLSIFEETGKHETLFHLFMTFQALFLCSLFFFLFCRNMNYVTLQNTTDNLKIIALIFSFLLAFYLSKRIMYLTVGAIFATAGQYRIWSIGYSAATGLWGTLLYLPVLWASFIETHKKIPLIMFISFFIIWRLIIAYKSIHIFKIKSIGVLYIFLYLCAMEIIPLIFFNEGIKYLYNFIDELALWH